MASKILRLPAVRGVSVTKRHFAAQASAQASVTSNYILPRQEAKTTTLPNGMVVTSLENYSPISRVALLFKAGSRCETADCLGVSHTLRAATGLSNEEHTSFGLTRNVLQLGGSLSCTTDRDYLMYDMQCLRSKIDDGLPYLTSAAIKHKYLPWELQDIVDRLRIDLALTTPQAYLIDDLHHAAYRNIGLGNSIFCPQHLVGSISLETLSKFVAENMTSQRAAVVATGMEHDQLVSYAQSISLVAGEGAVAGGKYKGGEIRVDIEGNLVYVAVAGEGASLKKPKDMVTQSVLQYILGVGPSTKRGAGIGKLATAAHAAGSIKCVSGISCVYQDSSLCGFYLVAEASSAGKVVPAVMGELKTLKITDGDLKRAKNQVKAAVLMANEDSANTLEDLGLQSLFNGRVETTDTIFKTVDSITAADVTALVKKVLSGKLSMAARGNLQAVPYLDEL